MKNKCFFIILLSLIITITGFSSAQGELINQTPSRNMNSYNGYTDANGKVIKLEPNNMADVEITLGKYKGQTVEVDDLKQFQTTDPNGGTLGAKVGDKVYLSIQQDDNGNIKNALIYDYVRYNPLIIVVVIFIMLLALIGGLKGITSLIPLLLTTFAIVKVVVPAIEEGMNPVLISVIVCIGLLVFNLLIISGINKKTVAAIAGSIFGIISSTALMLLTGATMKLTGIGDEDVEVLMSIFSNNHISFKGILFAGIILGALGALIDISISIASAMNEIAEANPDISKREFIKSGMSIGKDIIGAMSNTLILAYAGSSLVVLLIVLSNNLSFMKIINEDVIASEIFKALIGSIGLILSVPCTVITMAQLKVFSKK